MPPSGHAAIEPVEDEGCGSQGCSGKKLTVRLRAHVQETKKERRDSAGGIGQREHIGQVEPAYQGEVFGRGCGHGAKIYAGSLRMSRMRSGLFRLLAC